MYFHVDIIKSSIVLVDEVKRLEVVDLRNDIGIVGDPSNNVERVLEAIQPWSVCITTKHKV